MHRSNPFARSVLALATCLLPACWSVPVVGTEDNLLPHGELAPDQIRWPARYQPERATFFISNQIDIAAPPDGVSDVLVDVDSWPDWYAGATDLQLTSSTPGKLAPEAELSWNIMDLDFVSTVKEFDPPHRLGWESRKSTIQGYHTWLLIPTDQGTRLVTDESQFGFLAWLQGIFMPSKLGRLHDETLAKIKERAESRNRSAPEPSHSHAASGSSVETETSK
ncbi:MAG: SRPBCC domain-containing protein [Planctomycetes bacterium]|jgi:hypothetical protein|nr:SRPBCC domain-containing protein [Planctomycetota bacterium]